MKWALRILLGLVLLLLLAAGGAYVYLRQSLPMVAGSVTVAGTTGPVEIIRDRHGIPHIYARTADDAAFGLGYAQAQDRLWQMEMNRRVGAGRLAELFGAAALDTDKFLRTLGIRRHAEATLEHLSPETHARLVAYAAGVNAFLDGQSGPLPPEFLILGLRPEPWTPADSVSWIKMMAWDLSDDWKRELLRLRLGSRLSPQQVSEFLPPYPDDAPIALADLGQLYGQVRQGLERLTAMAPPTLPPGGGSNNWVVSGARSVTQKPLLANDPHLGLAAPAIWYFAHLSTPDNDIIGGTLPGLPAVVLGRNRHIAWGYTNTGPDVQDLFIEKIDPDTPGSYLTPDGPRPFATRTEVIKVKGAADVVLTVRLSRHGPIISDLAQVENAAIAEGYALAFAWTALRDDDLTVQAGLRMSEAHDWPAFIAGASDWHAPQQNMIYADTAGNIGFIAPGRIPLRKPENDLKGLAPAPGWDARYDWAGFVPFDELPRQFNPESGKVVTANHKIVPDDYPHFITSEWVEPYRARRIEALLAARPVHSFDSFAAMQADVLSAMVGDMLPYLLKLQPADDAAARALAALRSWNGEMAADRPEPLIVTAWLRELNRAVYADELGPLFEDAFRMRPIFLFNVLSDKDGQSRWCDDTGTPAKETCADQLARALDRALADLRGRYGDDMRQWVWGKAHAALSEHRPFSAQPVLRRIFNLEVPTPGDTYTVNVGQMRIADQKRPFANRHAASLRAIYDLADPDRSVFMHSTGQSGNPLSPLYHSFSEPWSKVQYVPMTTRRSEIETDALGRLLLKPRD